jgi:hypothetical protein
MEAKWQEAFDEYKEVPEYQNQHSQRLSTL